MEDRDACALGGPVDACPCSEFIPLRRPGQLQTKVSGCRRNPSPTCADPRCNAFFPVAMQQSGAREPEVRPCVRPSARAALAQVSGPADAHHAPAGQSPTLMWAHESAASIPMTWRWTCSDLRTEPRTEAQG